MRGSAKPEDRTCGDKALSFARFGELAWGSGPERQRHECQEGAAPEMGSEHLNVSAAQAT